MEVIWKYPKFKNKEDEIAFKDLYMISNKGDVKSLRSGKILKHSISRGYHRATLCSNGYSKTIGIHVLVATTFVDNPNKDEFKVVNHKDGDKSNNNHANLEWTNHSGNRVHALDTGLSIPKYGDDNNSTLISDEDVKWIRENYHPETLNQKSLSEKFNVTFQHISAILSNKERYDENYTPKYKNKTVIKDDDILNIVKLYQDGVSMSEIAIIYNVNKRTINRKIKSVLTEDLRFGKDK